MATRAVSAAAATVPATAGAFGQDRQPRLRWLGQVDRADVRHGPGGGLGGLDDGPVQAATDRMCRRDRDLAQTDGLEAGAVLREGQGARDAANEAAALGTVVWGEGIVRDDIADADATTRPQHASDL